MIPSIIELLYSKNINTINKFNTYKIIKEVYGNDKKQTFTYYKANILYNKLLETKILVPTMKKVFINLIKSWNISPSLFILTNEAY